MPMLIASCHCKNITLSVERMPGFLNECHCEVCRRYSARWAYYEVDEVHFDFDPALAADSYVCNDEVLDFFRCRQCGCVSHWRAKEGSRVGINARLFEPSEIASVEVRVSAGPSD